MRLFLVISDAYLITIYQFCTHAKSLFGSNHICFSQSQHYLKKTSIQPAIPVIQYQFKPVLTRVCSSLEVCVCVCSSGINIFLDGYVPTENLRFRETSLVFKVAETASEEEVKKMCRYQYQNMKKALGEFSLSIVEGEFTDSEIMVMLGENGKEWLFSSLLYPKAPAIRFSFLHWPLDPCLL